MRLALYNQKYGSFKSSNKINPSKHLPDRSWRAKGEYGELSNFGKITNPFHQAAIRSKNVWESTIINCSGLALAAMDYVLHNHPKTPVSLISLPGHALMGIGEISSELASLPLGAWPENIQICDPWTNITCSAPEYPKRFLEKMEKWKNDDKLILNDKREWINPTNKNWATCIREVPAIQIRQRYEKGLFLDHNLIPAIAKTKS